MLLLLIPLISSFLAFFSGLMALILESRGHKMHLLVHKAVVISTTANLVYFLLNVEWMMSLDLSFSEGEMRDTVWNIQEVMDQIGMICLHLYLIISRSPKKEKKSFFCRLWYAMLPSQCQ